MTTEPTREQIEQAITLALPDWRRHHQRCPTGARCRTEHDEWIDVLLEDLWDTMRGTCGVR